MKAMTDGDYLFVLQRQLAWRRDLESKHKRRALKQFYPEEVARVAVTDPIRSGETFYVKPEFCRLIAQASSLLPNFAVMADMFPVQCAFVSLTESPWQLPARYRSFGTLSVIGWSFGVGRTPDVPGVWITGYSTGHHSSDDLVPTGNGQENWLPVGTTFLAFGDNARELADADQSPSKAPRHGENRVIDQQMQFAWKAWVFTFVLFIQQRIVATKKERVELPGPARRRAVRHRPELVRVVHLRRYVDDEDRPEGVHPIAWTCQWIVRGHWRNQWRPKLQVHRPTWILPYRKGPTDQPFKEARRVFAVVR